MINMDCKFSGKLFCYCEYFDLSISFSKNEFDQKKKETSGLLSK